MYPKLFRLTFPSDYSKPRAIEEKKEKKDKKENETADVKRVSSYKGNEALYSSMRSKLTIESDKRASIKSDTKMSKMLKFKGIDRRMEDKQSKKGGTGTTSKNLTQFKSKIGASSKRLLSKLSLRQSDKSLGIDERDEDSESEVISSKNYKTMSKKETMKDVSSYGINRTAFTIKKKKTRLYGILGVERLNPDDNILMRGNINNKKENSLSLATTHITKSELRDDKAMFYSDLSKMDEKIKRDEKELNRRKKMKNIRSVSICNIIFRVLKTE